MPDTTLVAQTGRRTGSPSSRRLRTEDNIPGVLYGQGMAPITLSVARRDLRLALSGAAGTNTLLSLSVEGKTYPAIVKDLQRHPIRRNVSHIDFLQVNMREEITISVPVHLVGEAKEVLNEGGLVDAAVDTIDVTCTPGNMPNEFVIDITDDGPRRCDPPRGHPDARRRHRPWRPRHARRDHADAAGHGRGRGR